MRKQIAAANWKMNLTIQQGEQLLDAIIAKPHNLSAHQQAVFAVPFSLPGNGAAKNCREGKMCS
jgi:triosephosphate isomerase